MEQLIDCRPNRQIGNSILGYLIKEGQYPTHCVGCGAELPMFRKPDAINTCGTVCSIKPPQRSKDKSAGKTLMNLVESMRKQTGRNHADIPS